MNKLKEIIEQSYVRIYNGDYDKNYEDTVKETIKDACVEYARSKILPVKKVSFKLNLESVERQKFIEEHLKIMFDEYYNAQHDGIDQDLQSINTK